MRSLWAGVSGLQAHQIAMDVEGNNIANVNTIGFKYSRANFADLLSQTSKIATAPQGDLGGKNPMQVGLGTQVSSITKIFKQGSIQTTDKNTDLAIQGDGFFVISPDSGKTYKYSRNGDFVFDAAGNFSDSNGYIVQGWMRDETTGEIDATAPIQNITVPPGLTTPAKDTEYITLKANLNSGDTIVNKKSIYALDQYKNWYDKNGDKARATTEINGENDPSYEQFDLDKKLTDRGIDMGVVFNSTGEALNLRNGQGTWISYAAAKTKSVAIDSTTDTNSSLDITINGTDISGSITGSTDDAKANSIVSLINLKSSSTGVTASIQNGNEIVLTNNNNTGTEEATKNIKLVKNSSDNSSLRDTTVITAYQYKYSSDSVVTTFGYDDSKSRNFHSTEDLREAMQEDSRNYINYTGDVVDTTATSTTKWANDGGARDTARELNYNPGAVITVNTEGQFQMQNTENSTAFDAVSVTGIDDAVNYSPYLKNSDVVFPAGTIFDNNTTIKPAADMTITDDNNNTYNLTAGTTYTVGVDFPAPLTLGADATFPQDTSTSTFGAASGTPQINVGTNGIIYNGNDGTASDQNMNLTVTALTDAANDISSNDKFTSSFSALQGSLITGNSIRTSQNLYAASHASSIDVYDSLGSKHTVRLDFTKTSSGTDGSEWSMIISVPEPGEINTTGSGLNNIILGSIKFGPDGSLSTFSPSSIKYSANNGSTPNQNILFNFGTLGQFDGMTSFDAQSNTSGISQDGYPGGDLVGIRIDETGTLVGSFTNGRSFGLAQVSMAKFSNNNGLESSGGNSFIQTSNSGNPIIGQAAIGGRGFIQASALEMSNVDLSRSLTQLIVVQRGFQANSKTITTSDQMLNTLLQLKQ